MDHWSPAVLLERAAYLRKLAKHSDGSASETLKEYPQHCAMLSFRSRDGEAEVHERFADLFCVLAGKATLVTGGSVLAARTVAPGETRGDFDRRRRAADAARGRCGSHSRRHAAPDAGEERRHVYEPGDEDSGSRVEEENRARDAEEIGAGDRDRTGDIQLGNVVVN